MKKIKTKEVNDASIAVANLVKFKRWLSGRGRKYVAGQSTVDVEVACEALGVAIDSLKHRLSHDEFRKLFRIAQCANIPLGTDGKKAMTAAKRIVRYIDKVDAK